MEKCLNCGSDDLMEFSDCKQCQRCGTKIKDDGWQEYNPNTIEENIQHYDRMHDDGESYRGRH